MGSLKRRNEGVAEAIRQPATIKDEDLHNKNLSLDKLKKSLPKEVFQKDLRRSLQWMIWDMFISGFGLYLVRSVYQVPGSEFAVQVFGETGSLIGETGSVIFKCVTMFLLQWITGFFMWAIFVSGHDCGHGTFSNYKEVNFLCGLITHGSILVPFQCWARSHRFHHLHHNHVEDDFSFPWETKPKENQDKFLVKYPFVDTFVLPVIGYFYYLVFPSSMMGVDGCHYLPGLTNCRIWTRFPISTDEMIRCWISVFAVCAYLYIYNTLFFTTDEFLKVYVPCWIFFIYFLYTVTYLQHHNDTTRVFDETTWKYTTAAFETVDRTYGWVVDLMHHHISDCHVVHHIFFTGIPHYNLRKATDHMVKHLEEVGAMNLYRCEDTLDFHTRVFKQMWKTGYRAKLITKKVE